MSKGGGRRGRGGGGGFRPLIASDLIASSDKGIAQPVSVEVQSFYPPGIGIVFPELEAPAGGG